MSNPSASGGRARLSLLSRLRGPLQQVFARLRAMLRRQPAATGQSQPTHAPSKALVAFEKANSLAEATRSGLPKDWTTNEPEDTGRFLRLVVLSFVLCVFLPSLLFGLYLGLVASPQYVSEIRLIVRSTDKLDNLTEGLSAFQKLVSKEPISSVQDGQIIVSYIKSRAAIEDAGGKDALARMFARSDIDWFSRLDPGDSYEKQVKYWNKRVSSSIDTVSNILTVRIKAYSPQDATQLARQVLDNSERLINHISDRSRKDALSRAQTEVERSATALAEQRTAMLDFRNRTGSIDPSTDVKEKSALIFSLTVQKTEIEAQMAAAAGSIDVGSVIDRQRKKQIDALGAKIEEVKATLTNTSSLEAVSEKLREYEQLRLRNQFAEKIYELSKREYETARQNLERQQIFVQTIVPPLLPESSTYPKVFIETLLMFIVIMMSWGAIVLIIASVADHTE